MALTHALSNIFHFFLSIIFIATHLCSDKIFGYHRKVRRDTNKGCMFSDDWSYIYIYTHTLFAENLTFLIIQILKYFLYSLTSVSNLVINTQHLYKSSLRVSVSISRECKFYELVSTGDLCNICVSIGPVSIASAKLNAIFQGRIFPDYLLFLYPSHCSAHYSLS